MMTRRLWPVLALGLLLSGCGDGDAPTDADADMPPSMDGQDMAMTDMDTDADTAIADTVDDGVDVPVPAEPEPAPSFGPDDIVMAMTDMDRTVRLVLTPTSLTMRLSDDVVTQLRSQVTSRDLRDDLKAAILSSIEETVLTHIADEIDEQRQKISKHSIRYKLDDINTLFYREGRLYVDLKREKPVSFDDIHTADGRPILANFDSVQAEEFARAYARL